MIQAIVDGLLIGGVYALIGVSLTLVFGVLRLINFAHGDLLMMGMYGVYFAHTRLGIAIYVTALLVVPLLFVFGAFIFRFGVRPVLRGPEIRPLLVTLGLSLILQNVALSLFSPETFTVRASGSSFTIGGILLGQPHLIALAASIATVLFLFWLLQRTDIGRKIRSSSEDRDAAALCGINVDRVFTLTFGLAAACLGVAAVVLMPFYYTSPSVGFLFTLIAFIVVVLGGLGSFFGALIAGFVVGLSESLGTFFLEGSYSRALIFAVFVAILLVRPQGIFGERRL